MEPANSPLINPQSQPNQAPINMDKKPTSGLFSSHQARPIPDPAYVTSLNNEVNDLTRRMKILEERYTNVRNKLQMNERNMINNLKKSGIDSRSFSSDMKELRRDLTEVNSKISLIIKEIQLSAKREDVDLLRKYLDLWDPMKFVTHNEVERLVDEIVDVKLAQLKRNV